MMVVSGGARLRRPMFRADDERYVDLGVSSGIVGGGPSYRGGGRGKGCDQGGVLELDVSIDG